MLEFFIYFFQINISSGNAVDELFSNNKSIYSQFLVIQPLQAEPASQTQIPPTSIVGSHHLHIVNAVSDVDKLFKYEPNVISKMLTDSCSNETNRQIFKLFEPLFTSVLQTYINSHEVATKQVALSMLSQLSKFGVCYSH